MRPEDRCPECGCGYSPERTPDENDVGGWDGYCGHFDCAACSILRAEKGKLWKRYADERARYGRL